MENTQGVFFNGIIDDNSNPKGYLAVLRFTEPKGLYLYRNDGTNEYSISNMVIRGFTPAEFAYDISYKVVINTNVESGKHSIQITGGAISIQAELVDNQYASGRVGYYTNKSEATFTSGFTTGNCALDNNYRKT